MGKPKRDINDPLVAQIRDILQSTEPRILPTKTKLHDWGHAGWECPYCGSYVPRKDRYRKGEQIVDYGRYNMHFAAMHATPFWKEKQIAALIRGTKLDVSH